MVRMPHWPTPILSHEIKLDLGRIYELMKNLGDPQAKLPPVIHIAGTNGKGSTQAFLKSIFEAAGYRVHSYTSPHLVRYNERIKIAGCEIDDQYLMQILERCRIASLDMKEEVTFFEGTTAAAFLAFAENEADVVLLETGMGGRLDATNILSEVALSVITPISFDHMPYLGASLAQIAQEKAGIMKQGCPCVVSYQEQEAWDVLEQRAIALNIPLTAYQYDFGLEKCTGGFLYQAQGQEDLFLPTPSLIGDHQIVNAGTAIAAIKQLQGFDINNYHIAAGMLTAKWPARLQRLLDGKLFDLLPPNSELWVDGAHNPAGGEVVANFAAALTDLPLYMIVGMTKGRDVEKFLAPISSYVTHLCSVYIDAEPTSLSAEAVAKSASNIGIKARAVESIAGALYKIAQIVKQQPVRVLVCGSLFLAGAVLAEN
jgi:dihydrofolate synthase/folylpolyglutamate synthase